MSFLPTGAKSAPDPATSKVAVWPVLMGAAVVLLAASLLLGDMWSAHVAGIMVCAYLAMQFKKIAFGDADLAFVASAAIWISAAVAIQRQAGENMTQNKSRLNAIKVLLTLCGSCYLWARVVSAPREFGSAPYMYADILAGLAMLLLGSGLLASIHGRNNGVQPMGAAWQAGHSHNYRRSFGFGRPLPYSQKKEKSLVRRATGCSDQVGPLI